MKVKDHFRIAELQNGKVTPGHYYCYKNDRTGHYNHVHVAFLPWGVRPCSPAGYGSDPCLAYIKAFTEKFGTKYRNGGVYVCKDRAGSVIVSQHGVLRGNAVDFMAMFEEQDPIIDWLESDWEEEDLNDEQAAQLKRLDDFVADLKGGEGGGISAQALADNGDFFRGIRLYIQDPKGKKPTDTWAAIGWDAAAKYLGTA